MKNNQLNLVYALQQGVLVHISQVESGLKCNCICPACGARLVARKGSIVMHHFAHYDADACQYGYETSLHLAAKEIIASAKKVWLPEVNIHFDSGRAHETVRDAMEVDIEDVKLEKTIDNIIPDIIISVGGKSFIIEIFVTHAIDDFKLSKIKKMDISTLEIDLSHHRSLITEAELTSILLGPADEKSWRYNSIAEKWKAEYIKASREYDILSRGFALHIDNCPMAMRTWRGKPYANYIDDCIGCQFYISNGREETIDDDEGMEDQGTILCSGEARIASIDDFNISYEERKVKYDSEQDDVNTQAIAAGRCPNCGGTLKSRNGQYGSFWGCSNYPHCRFTLNIDPETGELITKA